MDCLSGAVVAISDEMVSSISQVVNLFFDAKFPNRLGEYIASAPLTPLVKLGGGIRRIAVVRCGVAGGSEAILHSVNHLIEACGDDVGLLMLLLDFKNAFNLVDREVMLREVRLRCPAISRWVEFCYSNPARLYYREHTLWACQGVQQDTMVVWKVLELIMEDGLGCGMHLNVDKTEVFSQRKTLEAGLQLVMKRVAKTIRLMDAIAKINDPQCELLLLRSCAGISRLYFTMRTCLPRVFESAQRKGGIIGIKHCHNVVRDTLVDICYRSGILAGKEVDIGLDGGRDKPLRPAYMLLYSWDGGLDVCVDLTISSPLTQTGMVDFVPSRAVIDAAQPKRDKYMAKCAAIRYGFLPFSFSSLGELEAYAVTLLKRIQKNDPNLFSLKVNHGGGFSYVYGPKRTRAPRRAYKGGNADWFDDVDAYGFSVIEVSDTFVIDLYHEDNNVSAGLEGSNDDLGTHESEVLESGNAGLGTNEGEGIENNNAGLGTQESEGIDNDNVEELDPLFFYPNTNHQKGQLSEPISSPHRNVQGNDDNKESDDTEESEDSDFECDIEDRIDDVHVDMEMFKKNTDPSVEWECDLEDFDSDIDPDDDDDEAERKKALRKISKCHKPVDSHLYTKNFYVSQIFPNKEMIKDMVTRISVEKRRELYLTKNDKERVRAECRGLVPVFSNTRPSGDSVSNVEGPTKGPSGSQSQPSGIDSNKKKTNKGILTAVGVDPNNGIYPLAYVVVESETKQSWLWFLDCLGDDLELFRNSNFTFVTDKQKGIIPALVETFPAAKHRYCMKHIYDNMKLQWRGKLFKELLWRCATATIVSHFNTVMKKVKNVNKEVYDWLKDIPPQHWARSHFSDTVNPYTPTVTVNPSVQQNVTHSAPHVTVNPFAQSNFTHSAPPVRFSKATPSRLSPEKKTNSRWKIKESDIQEKKAKNKQIQARSGKDKVKSQPNLVDDDEEEEQTRQCARWTCDEEVLLTQCWIKISENGQIGADRTKDSFWRQIMDDFNSGTTQGYRTRNMLTGKWTRINGDCQKFNAIYKHHESKSGENEADHIEDAKVTFAAQYPKGIKFMLEHVWRILKGHSKWDASKPLDTKHHTEIFRPHVRPCPAGKTRPAKKTKSETTGSSRGSASGASGPYLILYLRS
ncbi:transposase, MuDR [Tanacetum coccineum]